MLLYYEDPYLQSCESILVDYVDIDDRFVGLVLDRTCFFPHGGGALGDVGSIDSSQVFEVTINKMTGTIIHPISRLEKNRFPIGMKVTCHIDWNRRYRIMKLHAGSHIMEHFLFSLEPGIRLLGTNVNENRDSSTYEARAPISGENVEKLNRLTNDFVAAAHPITTYQDPDRIGFRIWECNGIRIPCGGVHPRNTAEIGVVGIKRKGTGNRQEIRTVLFGP